MILKFFENKGLYYLNVKKGVSLIKIKNIYFTDYYFKKSKICLKENYFFIFRAFSENYTYICNSK